MADPAAACDPPEKLDRRQLVDSLQDELYLMPSCQEFSRSIPSNQSRKQMEHLVDEVKQHSPKPHTAAEDPQWAPTNPSHLGLHQRYKDSFSRIDDYLSEDLMPLPPILMADKILRIPRILSKEHKGEWQCEFRVLASRPDERVERFLEDFQVQVMNEADSPVTVIESDVSEKSREAAAGEHDACSGIANDGRHCTDDILEHTHKADDLYPFSSRKTQLQDHSPSDIAPTAQIGRHADISDLFLQRQRQDAAPLPGRVRKPRTVLPITIDGHTFDAIPDSGSEENIMTAQAASRLGLTIENDEQHQKEFRIANGNVVKSLGRVRAICAFAKDQGVALVTSFYVFKTMVSDLIMGMDFLDATETLTKHKHRLEKKVLPLQGIPQLSALNNPKRRLRCLASGQTILANADTGAEMNLVSANYAQCRGLLLQKLSSGETQVQLADGSTTYLAGKVFLTINLDLTYHGTSFDPRREFYVLEGLTCSILLGEDALEDLNAFETYRDNLVLEKMEDNIMDQPEVCTILWFDTLERFLTPKDKPNPTAPPSLSAEEEDTTLVRPLSERAMTRVQKFFSRTKEPTKEFSNDSDPLPSFEARQDERDARENYRQELAREAISKIPLGPARDEAILTEATKSRDYEADKQLVFQARSAAILGNRLAGSKPVPSPSTASSKLNIPLTTLSSSPRSLPAPEVKPQVTSMYRY